MDSVKMIEESSETIKSENVKYQYIAAAVVNIMIISNGIMAGWLSPSIYLLTSDDPPLPTGKITMAEASWIASLMDVGSLIGCFLFGYTTVKFSRKWVLFIIPIPVIASWCLVLVAQNIYYFYVMRILHGIIYTGVKITIYSFLIEITADRIRGFVISFMNLSLITGNMTALTLGTFCDFHTTPKFVMGLIAFFVILFYFIPESPVFLMKQNKISEAERSIRFYKNLNKSDVALIRSEMDALMKSIGNVESRDNEQISVKFSDFVTKPGRKVVIIAFILIVLSQFTGSPPMMSYTANILRDSGSTLTPNISAIVVGLIQLTGSFIATSLINRVRRKVIIYISVTGMAASEITLGTYTMLKSWNYDVETHNWIPLVSFSVFVLTAYGGLLALVFVYIAEIMPLKLKDVGMTFSMVVLLSSQFIMVKFFPLLSDLIGFHGSMFLYAGICFMTIIFAIFFVPETKGKSREEILDMLK